MLEKQIMKLDPNIYIAFILPTFTIRATSMRVPYWGITSKFRTVICRVYTPYIRFTLNKINRTLNVPHLDC